jgi:hypothetical protein
MNDRNESRVQNDEGILIRWTRYHSNGKPWKVYRYNDDGNVTSYSRFNELGRVLATRQYDIIGNVTQKCEYNKNENVTKRYTYKYNDDRNVIEEREYNSKDILKQKITRSYDSKENLIEFRIFEIDGKLKRRETFEYNEKGEEIECREYDNENELVSICKNLDGFGNSEEIYYKKDGSSYINRISNDYDEEIYYNSKGKVTLTKIYTFIDSGHILEVCEYKAEKVRKKTIENQEKKTVETQIFNYDGSVNVKIIDENSKTIEMSKHSKDGSLVRKSTSNYHNKGGKAEQCIYNPDGGRYIKRFNRFGDLTAEERYDKDNNMSIIKFEKGKKIETSEFDSNNTMLSKSTYKFDDDGKEIEKCIYHSDGSKTVTTYDEILKKYVQRKHNFIDKEGKADVQKNNSSCFSMLILIISTIIVLSLFMGSVLIN